MKQLLLTTLLTAIIALNGFGQQKTLIKADKHFKKHEYTAAIDEYSKYLATKNSGEVTQKLAQAYMAAKRYPEALETYRVLIKLYPAKTELMLPYADLLMSQKSYKAARVVLKRYLNYHPEDRALIMPKLRACGNYSSLSVNKFAVKAEATNFNSEFNDFSPTVVEDKLIWCSSRAYHKSRYLWDNQHFINLFEGQLNGIGQIDDATAMPKTINSKLHEGPATFDQATKTLYFTRNTSNEREQRNLQIMYTQKEGDEKWSKPKHLNFHKKHSSEGHPTISKDGQTMYLVTNYSDGYGGTDLYKSSKTPYGKWGTPENLGKSINTNGNELFPYIADDGYLYFSSDTHPGLGGLDLFRVKVKGDKYGEVEHLGAPFNSEKDDFGICLIGRDSTDFRGFFSSNRGARNGNDDIYHFQNIMIDLNVTVKDKENGKSIPMASIELIDDKGKVVRGVSDEFGEYFIRLNPEIAYKVNCDKKRYTTEALAFDTKGFTENKTIEKEIYLSKGYTPHLTGKVVNGTSNTILPKAVVVLKDVNTGDVRSYESEDGYYDFSVQPGSEYLILAQKTDFMSHEQTVSVPLNQMRNINRISPLERLKKNKILDIENIYYEFDRAAITPESRTTLNKVIRILKNNPDIVLELSSHTDARGTDEYNKVLSQKRAKSALAYFEKFGIEPFRLVYKYYGETQPKMPCPNGDCPEEVHAANRRTEFKILDF